MKLEKGTKLGPYEIRSKIGAGGMGEVYLTHDTQSYEARFIGAVLGTLLGREPAAEAKYDELLVRASTGIGSEKASGH